MRNSGRQLEIDIAKGIAIIFMVLVHSSEYFYSGATPAANAVIEFLGSPPAAPVFMLALGVGVVYSKNATSEHFFRRGCQMFILSYVYNFFVYALPHLINYVNWNDSEEINVAIEEFANVDILQFASLAFITFAVIKKFKWGPRRIAAYGVAVSLAGEAAVKYIEIPEGGLCYILGLFFGTSEVSFFPYASWIIFPLAGYIFGKVLIDCENKSELYLNLAKISIPVYIAMMVNASAAGIDFGQITGEYQTSYYHLGLYGNICLLSFVFGWLAVCYALSRVIPENLMDYFKMLSRNITKIYVLQYVLIIYSYEFIAGEESNMLLIEMLVTAAAIFFAAQVLSNARIRIPVTAERRKLA